MIASTQVCDSVPEAVGRQLRIEAFESDIDLRCSTPTLFKGEMLQQVHNPWRQRNGSDRSLFFAVPRATCIVQRSKSKSSRFRFLTSLIRVPQ